MRLLRLPTTRRDSNNADIIPLCEDPCAEYLLRSGAYCKLLQETEQWKPDALAAAENMLQEEMAFVPGGSIELMNVAAKDDVADEVGSLTIDVDHFFMDRCAVSNAQFKRFVDADAYRDASFWPVQIQSYVFQFVDSTGQPGPAHWCDGSYAPEKRDHPVVGISWHEANAFANWLGKSLPTSVQWQRAGMWWNPEARFPWGVGFEEGRANTYASGHASTVPVTEYSDSATPNDIRQLVGNVWEWVDACFAAVEFQGQILPLWSTLAEVRGGAFDTYLTSQATCSFRSGLPLLTRNHNVGFRCITNHLPDLQTKD